MATAVPMRGGKSIEDHITVGPGKVAAALRHQAWEGGAARNLTPPQGLILVFLIEHDGQRTRWNDVADALCMTAAMA